MTARRTELLGHVSDGGRPSNLDHRRNPNREPPPSSLDSALRVAQTRRYLFAMSKMWEVDPETRSKVRILPWLRCGLAGWSM